MFTKYLSGSMLILSFFFFAKKVQQERTSGIQLYFHEKSFICWILLLYAGNKTSRGLCPKCDRKAYMDCLAGQNGHCQSQTVVYRPPSSFSVQPNDPSMLCDHFMDPFLYSLLPANYSWACGQSFFCLKLHADEADGSVQHKMTYKPRLCVATVLTAIVSPNRPFPSLPQSLSQSESKWEIWVMVTSSNFNIDEDWYSWLPTLICLEIEAEVN